MKAYLDILGNIHKNCHDIRDNRTGIPDIGLGQGATFVHDMDMGFPLITTKKMGLKNIATELEFFIHGITDKKWLTDRKCHIWDEWSNPTKWQPKYEQAIKNNPTMSESEKTEIKNQITDDGTVSYEDK